MRDPIKKLKAIDAQLFTTITAKLKHRECPISEESKVLFVDDTLWGLRAETAFGYAVAGGYLDLLGRVEDHWLLEYHMRIHAAGENSPTVGKLIAQHLVAVLLLKDVTLIELFDAALRIMLTKGAHVLPEPLRAASAILTQKDRPAGVNYFKLLIGIYSQPLTYNQFRHLTHHLPKGVESLDASKRSWQISALNTVLRKDFHLADAFFEGLQSGLNLLSKDAFEIFIQNALAAIQADYVPSIDAEDSTAIRKNRKKSANFLSLASARGRDFFLSLQSTVGLTDMQEPLNRYITARTGKMLTVRSADILPHRKYAAKTCSDGSFIYLPHEVSIYDHRADNRAVYWCLAKFESAQHEYGTYDFDIEKTAEIIQRNTMLENTELCPDIIEPSLETSGLEQFLKWCVDHARFDDADKKNALRFALDLFTIFEHGRIRALLSERYPGIIRRYLYVLQADADRHQPVCPSALCLTALYREIALEMRFDYAALTREARKTLNTVTKLFEQKMMRKKSIEICGELVFRTFADLWRINNAQVDADAAPPYIHIPFDRGFRLEIYHKSNKDYIEIARKLKRELSTRGFKVYTSDIVSALKRSKTPVSATDIEKIVIYLADQKHPEEYTPHGNSFNTPVPMPLTSQDIDLNLIFKKLQKDHTAYAANDVYEYHEWDCTIGDYLSRHVRVHPRHIPIADNTFFERTLKRYDGLVKQVKYAFELLKPEHLKLLRPWVEGDEFDYRALIDAAIDRKAGKMPSERLYIKRLKQERDVAVLLLVDISRSTGNRIKGSLSTVLDIEKEAIVIFCEALTVVGDRYAIAGFSGKGRFGVDYFPVKEFNDPMNPTIKNRISALAPQRSTRMGAAIRHAAHQLENEAAPTRILLILGDGFPNDTGYQQNYAIEDTRKSILEARSGNIHVKAITVNIAMDDRLDRLYGATHHSIITDVRELPDKLLSTYRNLTG